MRRGIAPVFRCGDEARAKRSEEHTSELQSQSNLVCRLLLEKKKNRPLHRPRSRAAPPSPRRGPTVALLHVGRRLVCSAQRAERAYLRERASINSRRSTTSAPHRYHTRDPPYLSSYNVSCRIPLPTLNISSYSQCKSQLAIRSLNNIPFSSSLSR